MMWWIILAILHMVDMGLWYRVATLPNNGTGGLSALVLPIILTLITAIIDIVVIIYLIFK